MKKEYISPEAICICFSATSQIAATAPINLIEGSGGLGNAAKTSVTDIRINL